MCPVTGAHFHKDDMCVRLVAMKKRRDLIDRAIMEEYRLEHLATLRYESHKSAHLVITPKIKQYKETYNLVKSPYKVN